MYTYVPRLGCGVYDRDDLAEVLNPPTPSFGTKMSTSLGDGKWCPECRKNNFYNWIDYISYYTEDGYKVEAFEMCSKCGHIDDI